ncbi:Alanine racemase [hydrothermal vent metagenome]|uniref:Alanine racemase n=1 Tax=hydrothermal vent metagenome TaxID=652676 RepID=A0A3B0XUT3_9ZZZZ
MTARRGLTLSVDLSALRHNFQQIKHYTADSKVMAVIKADAYGHGMLQVARALDQADGFAVAQLSEAVFLRQKGIDKPISVFQGFTDRAQLQQAVRYQLRPAISQRWQLDLLESKLDTGSLDVWLKINTGMGRLGFQPEDVAACWQRLQGLNSVNQSGLMTHFANADVPQHKSNQQQISCFSRIADSLKAETSVSNSAAIMSGLLTQQDWVRPGIMLYGASPLQGRSAEELALKPVMKLQAELIAINPLKKASHVGYGDSWICPENMPVGIVNMGYADGYPRHALTGTPVSINNQRSQLIGRVSMDSIAVDLRGIEARCGDMVELWGDQVPIDEVALRADTIAYELLCHAGRSF